MVRPVSPELPICLFVPNTLTVLIKTCKRVNASREGLRDNIPTTYGQVHRLENYPMSYRRRLEKTTSAPHIDLSEIACV